MMRFLAVLLFSAGLLSVNLSFASDENGVLKDKTSFAFLSEDIKKLEEKLTKLLAGSPYDQHAIEITQSQIAEDQDKIERIHDRHPLSRLERGQTSLPILNCTSAAQGCRIVHRTRPENESIPIARRNGLLDALFETPRKDILFPWERASLSFRFVRCIRQNTSRRFWRYRQWPIER